MTPLMNCTNLGTSKIRSDVFDFCTTFPLTRVSISASKGSILAIQGPKGAKVSKLLARVHFDLSASQVVPLSL